MQHHRTLLALLSACILVMTSSAYADVLWLKNGDRISGTVVASEAEIVRLKTSYLGGVAIPREAIANMRIGAPELAAYGGNGPAWKTEAVMEDAQMEPEPERVETPPSLRPPVIEETDIGLSSPPIELSGRLNAGANLTDGNSDTRTYYGDTEFVARGEKKRLTLGGRYSHVENGGDATLDYQLGYIKFDNFINGRLYLHSNGTGVWDKFKDLRLQSTLGLGLGYQFLETAITKLSFELSGSYVNEDHIVADDSHFTSSRWALDFDQSLYGNHIQFFHNHVGLMSLSDTEDTSLRAQTGLRFKIHNGLIATAQLNHNWDNTPSPGRRPLDEAYLFTLGHKF